MHKPVAPALLSYPTDRATPYKGNTLCCECLTLGVLRLIYTQRKRWRLTEHFVRYSARRRRAYFVWQIKWTEWSRNTENRRGKVGSMVRSIIKSRQITSMYMMHRNKSVNFTSGCGACDTLSICGVLSNYYHHSACADTTALNKELKSNNILDGQWLIWMTYVIVDALITFGTDRRKRNKNGV